MAQAPTKGLTFTVDNRKIVFGAMDNGDANVVVLAVEKGVNANDYSWETQIDIDLLKLRHGDDINAAMGEAITEANGVLDKLFGKVDEPVTDLEKYQAYIMNNLAYDPVNNKIVSRS